MLSNRKEFDFKLSLVENQTQNDMLYYNIV